MKIKLVRCYNVVQNLVAKVDYPSIFFTYSILPILSQISGISFQKNFVFFNHFKISNFFPLHSFFFLIQYIKGFFTSLKQWLLRISNDSIEEVFPFRAQCVTHNDL